MPGYLCSFKKTQLVYPHQQAAKIVHEVFCFPSFYTVHRMLELIPNYIYKLLGLPVVTIRTGLLQTTGTFNECFGKAPAGNCRMYIWQQPH